LRRFLVIALCLVPLAAGCGSGSSDSGKSPLDNALGYMPKSAPLVVAVDTDLNGGQWKSLTANVKKFPFSGQISSGIKNSLQQTGLDFDKDIKPLLGNEFVVSLPTATVGGSGSQVVAAIQVADKGKLSSLLSGDKRLKKDGSSNGATFYRQTDGGETVQDGDVLLVTENKQQATAAIEQRSRDDRLTQDTFNRNLGGLPSDALVRGYVDEGALLSSSPAAATARKVKWVGALKTSGFTVSSQSDGLSIDFNAKTDSSQLQDSDLPIASGDDSPPVSTKSGEIGVGIRGLNQTIHFAESVAAVVSPASYSNFRNSENIIKSHDGLDLEKDLVDQLSGNTSISSDVSGHYAIRVEPKDPAALAQTLKKSAAIAPDFAEGAGLKGAKISRVRGLYKLTGSSGQTIYYGMVGKLFVASNNLSSLAQAASDTPQPVQGAKGAVAINADVGKLASELIARAAGGGLGGAFGGSLATAPLGNLTGWVNSNTSGLTGHLHLAIK
jgi:hypothetical protein